MNVSVQQEIFMVQFELRNVVRRFVAPAVLGVVPKLKSQFRGLVMGLFFYIDGWDFRRWILCGGEQDLVAVVFWP